MGVGVASNDRPVCGQIINIAVVVDIPEMSALRPFHKDGSSAANGLVGSGGAVYAPHNMLQRRFIQHLRGWSLISHHIHTPYKL
ncbi:hypothetical protein D3C78_1643370 [compost metagenome]